MKLRRPCDRGNGFTLIELLVVIGILAVLAGLGLFLGIDAYKSYSLRSERDSAVSLLQRARSRALANIRESNHGLYIGGAQYVLFQGSSYATRNSTYDEIVAAAPGITATGTPEFVFSQLSGDASASGTVVISNGITSLTIAVNSEGRVEW